MILSYWHYKQYAVTTKAYSILIKDEHITQTPKSFRGARTFSRSSITMPSVVGLGFLFFDAKRRQQSCSKYSAFKYTYKYTYTSLMYMCK